MILYHATTAKNLKSILNKGLLTSKTKPDAKLKGVWLHSFSDRFWATLHIQKRHSVHLDKVIIITVSVRKKDLRRYRKGIYVSKCDISPENFKGFIFVADWI